MTFAALPYQAVLLKCDRGHYEAALSYSSGFEFLISTVPLAVLIVVMLWLRDRRQRRTTDRLLERRMR